MKKTCKSSSLLIALLLAFSLAACKRGKTEGVRQGGPQALMVDAMIAMPVSLSQQIVTTASLLPYEEVELRAPVSGTVMEIFFREGQAVKAGQPLVQIDDRVWRAQIRGLKARLLTAENEWKRNESLYQVEGVSREVADQSKASVEELQAKIEELTVFVKLAQVSAPFSGTLGMRNFSLGSYLSQGQAITRLAQTDKVKVEFDLASQYLDRIAKGQLVKLVAFPDTVEAVIYAIDPVVSSISRTLKVRALIDPNDKGLVPGDFVEVIIVPSRAEALVVPTDAIVPELNAQALYVAKDGKAEKRQVELGTRTATQVEVISGLKAGDTVLTTGLIQLRPQMPVNIRRISTPETP